MYMNLYIGLIILLQSFANAYIIPLEFGKGLSRRQMIVGLSNICFLPKPALSTEDNKPLTDQEMKEYERLLKEADRIKHIIKANKEAFENDFNNFNKTK